jgi:hypothetical protein
MLIVVMLSVILVSVIILSVIILSVIVLSVIMLSVIMQSVAFVIVKPIEIILSVTVLSVVAPEQLLNFFFVPEPPKTYFSGFSKTRQLTQFPQKIFILTNRSLGFNSWPIKVLPPSLMFTSILLLILSLGYCKAKAPSKQ